MHDRRHERGFTIVEVLVAIALFSVVSVAFYQVLFATARGSETAQDVARVSEEARLGLNRLVRDAREASEIDSPGSTSYTIRVDYDADGAFEVVPDDPAGNYEVLIVSWNSVSKTVTLSNGVTSEVLMRGVDCIRKADNSCHDVFVYSSSRLEYDSNADGVTTPTELDDAPSLGNNSDTLDSQELNFVDAISYSFAVEVNDRSENFYAEAQMRNQR